MASPSPPHSRQKKKKKKNNGRNRDKGQLFTRPRLHKGIIVNFTTTLVIGKKKQERKGTRRMHRTCGHMSNANKKKSEGEEQQGKKKVRGANAHAHTEDLPTFYHLLHQLLSASSPASPHKRWMMKTRWERKIKTQSRWQRCGIIRAAVFGPHQRGVVSSSFSSICVPSTMSCCIFALFHSPLRKKKTLRSMTTPPAVLDLLLLHLSHSSHIALSILSLF